MTELELRRSVVNVMRSWLGWSEANGKYRKIIDLYNTQKPLPRGYKLQYDDEWCAATVTAAGIQAGLETVIFGECSCPKMVELYQQTGRWMENDAYKPQIGDIVMYRWDDGANYATTDNTSSPNHVGMVAEVNGRVLTIIEGNKGQKVATRSLFVNGRYIRGYCLPDYKSKSEEDDSMSYEQFKRYMDQYRAELASQAATMPDLVDNAKTLGLTDGSRPRDFLTREEGMVMARAAVLAKK
jgi:hypothetical protein